MGAKTLLTLSGITIFFLLINQCRSLDLGKETALETNIVDFETSTTVSTTIGSREIELDKYNKTRVGAGRRVRRRRRKRRRKIRKNGMELSFVNNTIIPTHLTGPKKQRLRKTKRINRCLRNNGGCSHVCNKKGKLKCSCLSGFRIARNRKMCIDINECYQRRKTGKGCDHFCTNTLGSFFCSCNPGFRLHDDRKSCEDINECLLRNGHGPCQDQCLNTVGSYLCECSSNLSGTRISEKDKHRCEDVDECHEGKSRCEQDMCINTFGSYFCFDNNKIY